MKKARILFWDIETTPNIVTSFGLDVKNGIHFQNIIQERTVICVSWKWLGDPKISSVSVTAANPMQDKEVLQKISKVIQEADAIVAHYGDNFDLKYVNSRLAFHKLPPLPNVIQIDTWKMARQKFYFNSNKLDYLAQFLGLGNKIRTNYELWRKCMNGDSKALKDMVTYNKHDVKLLEDVYLRLAPFVKTKINVVVSDVNCASCGSQHMLKDGVRRTVKGYKQDYKCADCGHYTHVYLKKGEMK